MSYDIMLVDPVTEEVLELDNTHQMYGGTYAVGGTKEARINITYNYSKFYYMIYGDLGIRFLYGMTGLDSIPHLKEGISMLYDDASDNYWEATEGNAKKPLVQLLTLAKLRPDGVWKGD